MIEPWDKPVRSDQYSIVTKRHRMERFMDDPTRQSLDSLAESMWAFDIWKTVEFPVEQRLLGNGHTPVEFRDFLQASRQGTKSVGDPETPDLGTRTISELLEAMDGSAYATLNGDARDGLDALGYPVPGRPVDGDEYEAFVEHTTRAVEEYDLRDRLTPFLHDGIPEGTPPVDIAQLAFQLHGDDEHEFDLAAIDAGD